MGKPVNSIPGAAKPRQRPVLVTFNNAQKKNDLLRNKAKYRDELRKDNVMIFEDLTRARRILLSTVKEKFRSAHSRNGDICFFKNNVLTRIAQPNDLFSHGFDEDEIEKCEKAVMNSA